MFNPNAGCHRCAVLVRICSRSHESRETHCFGVTVCTMTVGVGLELNRDKAGSAKYKA